MSLRIVPASSHPSTTNLQQLGAPSAPGVHDTLRHNLNLKQPVQSSSAPAAPVLQSAHPLESRLAQWRTQQNTLKMELLRRQFGIAEPVKRGMELQIVRAGEWRPAALGGGGTASLHADILEGRDSDMDWEDVYPGGEELRDAVDFHTEMEGRLRMNW